MELMATLGDNAFDLAIVDPPYGGNVEHVGHKRTDGSVKYSWAKKYAYGVECAWDVAPDEAYFSELKRVSRHQIIWGYNYLADKIGASRNFIVWRKKSIGESFSMAMAELASVSIPGNAKVFECVPQSKERFHPTQKPIALYRWILQTYAQEGWNILDTHTGSATCAAACLERGFSFLGSEIDEGYYAAGLQRCRDIDLQGRFL
jgi:site-specific DNA-methyltransferase (adenine-specific)